MAVGDVAVRNREKCWPIRKWVEHGHDESARTVLAALRRSEAHGLDDAYLHTQIGYPEQLRGEKNGSALS